MTAQEQIDLLAGYIRNQDRARERGDARSIASYKQPIEDALKALEAFGYDRVEILTWIEEAK